MNGIVHHKSRNKTKSCRARFELLRDEHAEARGKLGLLEQRLADLGTGAVKAREKLVYQRETFRARHRHRLPKRGAGGAMSDPAAAGPTVPRP